MTTSSIPQIFRSAAADRLRGAAAIEVALVRDLVSVEDRWRRGEILEGAEVLLQGQPAMANLRNLAVRAGTADLVDFSRWLAGRLRVLERLPELLAANAWPMIEASSTLVTISRSSAVTAVVEGARSRGWSGAVAVLDGSIPGCGGEQTRILSENGEAMWYPETALRSVIERDGVIVVVGADAVGPVTFINASGTGALVVAARDRGSPRLVVADTGKDVREADVDAILGVQTSDAPFDVEVLGFERVRNSLISARISETRASLC